jgi:hypothetical protein
MDVLTLTIERLHEASALEVQKIHGLLQDPARLKKLRLKSPKTYVFMDLHEPFPERAHELKQKYVAVVHGQYVCPQCFIRTGEVHGLGESRKKTGVRLDCPVCKFKLVAEPPKD